MKKYINKLLVTGLAIILLIGCEEEVTLTVLKEVRFTGTPEVSSSAVAISEENLDETVLEISWPEVVYPVDGPVTYTLEFSMVADTSGANGWIKIASREVGEDILSASFTGDELNKIATEELGIVPETQGLVVVRIKSTMDRNIYSDATGFQLTPFESVPPVIEYPSLYIAGDFQGWNIDAPVKISSVNDDGIYEGYFYIPAGGTNEFKLYAQPAWEPTSYGDGGDGTIIVANFAGANFVAPSEGYYLLSVDLNDMTYILMETSWGIIGAATPGGWDADTPLTYDPETQTWSVTADLIANGSFKFRANNAWALDFGVVDEKLAYANHPWKAYVDQPHFSVPSDGNYTVTLDLHVPGNYTYKIKKN